MQTIRLCSLRRVGTGPATIRRTRAASSSPARRASPAPARRHRARAARVVQQARRCAPLLHIHSFARAPLQTLTLRRGWPGVGQDVLDLLLPGGGRLCLRHRGLQVQGPGRPGRRFGPSLPPDLLERNSSQRGVQLPNPEFWGSLGGLVKDGVGFTMDQAQGKKGSKEGARTPCS